MNSGPWAATVWIRGEAILSHLSMVQNMKYSILTVSFRGNLYNSIVIDFSVWERESFYIVTQILNILALDTLAIMGNFTEFNRVYNLIAESRTDFDANINVSVFETNIRIVGGLLSAHLLAHRGFYLMTKICFPTKFIEIFEFLKPYAELQFGRLLYSSYNVVLAFNVDLVIFK